MVDTDGNQINTTGSVTPDGFVKLSSLKLKTENVHVRSGGHFVVRGLTYEDFNEIMAALEPCVMAIFDGVRIEGGTVIQEDIEAFRRNYQRASPTMFANIIARAAVAVGKPNPGDVTFVQTLPFTVQVDAMIKIAGLTMNEGEGWIDLMDVFLCLSGVFQPPKPPKQAHTIQRSSVADATRLKTLN